MSSSSGMQSQYQSPSSPAAWCSTPLHIDATTKFLLSLRAISSGGGASVASASGIARGGGAGAGEVLGSMKEEEVMTGENGSGRPWASCRTRQTERVEVGSGDDRVAGRQHMTPSTDLLGVPVAWGDGRDNLGDQRGDLG